VDDWYAVEGAKPSGVGFAPEPLQSNGSTNQLGRDVALQRLSSNLIPSHALENCDHIKFL
jgi:hypothetical protein